MTPVVQCKNGWRIFWGAALLVVAVMVAYWPALHGQYILDDDDLLTHNALIASPDGLARFWFTTQPTDYWPLSSTTFWFEWRLWGMNPTGYHATNVALHIVNVLLLWTILRKLSIPGAFLAALLFAIHPVAVESVAWIAQRKTLLSTVFFLLSILWYLQIDRPTSSNRKERDAEVHSTKSNSLWYGLSLLAFILGMLSKGSVVILPPILLLLIWWRDGGLTRHDIVRTSPFFAAALVLMLVNIWFQKHGKEIVIRDVNFIQRLLGAGAVVWFYLGKAVWPVNLIFVYSQWDIQPTDFLWWLPLIATVACTAVLWWQRHSRLGRPLFFAWCFFGLALLPVMGFVDVGYMKFSLVADHYQYIALMAVVALAAAGFDMSACKMSESMDQINGPLNWTVLFWAMQVGVVLVVGWLGFLCWSQSSLYAGPIGLYSDTLAHNPNSWLAHQNLGAALSQENQQPQAIEEFQQALQIYPHNWRTLCNFGIALEKLGRHQEAIEKFQQVLETEPDYGPAHFDLGNTLLHMGRIEEAIDQFRQSLQLNANDVDARVNLGASLGKLGRHKEAIEELQQAIQIDPNRSQSYNSLGNILLDSGQEQAAIEQFQQALLLDPNYNDAGSNLGIAFMRLGRTQEAIDQFHKTLRNNPASAAAHTNLGITLGNAGQTQAALEEFQQALQLDASDANVYYYLALAENQLNHTVEAQAAAHQGLELAKQHGDSALAQQIETWLKSSSSASSEPAK